MGRAPDEVLGYILLVGSLVGIGCYFYLVFMSPWAPLVVQVSAFLAVTAILAIIAWIGYTLATTPPPLPLEDFVEEPSNEDVVT
ncbi:MAG: transcriptional regulator [Dehalococcoidia bacterium]|nr:transcriptional regulator [Dehalococcoidia bacterium]